MWGLFLLPECGCGIGCCCCCCCCCCCYCCCWWCGCCWYCCCCCWCCCCCGCCAGTMETSVDPARMIRPDRSTGVGGPSPAAGRICCARCRRHRTGSAPYGNPCPRPHPADRPVHPDASAVGWWGWCPLLHSGLRPTPVAGNWVFRSESCQPSRWMLDAGSWVFRLEFYPMIRSTVVACSCFFRPEACRRIRWKLGADSCLFRLDSYRRIHWMFVAASARLPADRAPQSHRRCRCAAQPEATPAESRKITCGVAKETFRAWCGWGFRPYTRTEDSYCGLIRIPHWVRWRWAPEGAELHPERPIPPVPISSASARGCAPLPSAAGRWDWRCGASVVDALHPEETRSPSAEAAAAGFETPSRFRNRTSTCPCRPMWLRDWCGCLGPRNYLWTVETRESGPASARNPVLVSGDVPVSDGQGARILPASDGRVWAGAPTSASRMRM